MAGATTSGDGQSFYEKHKILIIASVTVIFLVLGVLVAVLIAKKAKGGNADLTGGAAETAGAMYEGVPTPGFHYGVDGGVPPSVPQFVGGGAQSALPMRAWNESASVYVRR